MRRVPLLKLLRRLEVKVMSNQPNSNGWIPCLCPFAPYTHEKGYDRNPSFFAKVNEHGLSGWHCFTCKEKSGRMSSMVRLLGRYREVDYRKLAIKADKLEIPDTFRDFDEEEEFESSKPLKPIMPEVFENMYPLATRSKRAMRYLEGRGVHYDAVREMRLRYDPDEKRVLFPVQDRTGNVYGFSGRTVLREEDYPERQYGKPPYTRHRDYDFKKDAFLLGEQLYQKGKPVWLVEGMFAYARMVAIGARKYVNPMAPLMSSVSPRQLDRLIDMGEAVYLCFDDDKAGDEGIFGKIVDGKHKGGGAYAHISAELPTIVPPYPSGVSDPDKLTLRQLRWMLKQESIHGQFI